MKKLLFLLIAILFSSTLLAQEPEDSVKHTWRSPKYAYYVAGFGNERAKFSLLSPLYEQGESTGLIYGSEWNRWGLTVTRYISSFLTNYGGLTDSWDDCGSCGSMMVRSGTNFLHTYLYPKEIYQDEYMTMNVSFGLNYWLEFDAVMKDNQNNSLFYNLSNMLCLTLQYQLFMGPFHVTNDLIIPFAGIYSASEYSSSLPFFLFEDNASYKDAFHFGSINMNKQFTNRLTVDYRYHNKRRNRVRTIRTQYEIGAQLLEINNNVKHTNTFIMSVGYLFNPKKMWYVH